MGGLYVVTGAFGYTGRYITQRLLQQGHRVRTLTNSPNRPNPFGGAVEAFPLCFDAPEALAESLREADGLINTYWVRFNHKDFNHTKAVENTRILFEAAKKAGIKRIVHTSITNPSEDSPLSYFQGKARLERTLVETGISYAILRPAVLFGYEDILINNIAWMLRRFPLFGMFGRGDYRLQPIHVDDFADLAVREIQASEKVIIDAIGPETFTYRELVSVIAGAIGCERSILEVSPLVGYLAGWVISQLIGDVTITRAEIKGLMDGLLYTESPPAGNIRLTDWIAENRQQLGRHYASELARRVERDKEYSVL